MHQTSIWTEYLANMTSLFCVNFIEKKLTQHGRTVRFGGQVFTVWEWSQSSSVSEYQVIYWSQTDIWYQQISTSMVVISENENLDRYIRYSRMKENKKNQTWILLILEAVTPPLSTWSDRSVLEWVKVFSHEIRAMQQVEPTWHVFHLMPS